jgi:hypothetical protein
MARILSRGIGNCVQKLMMILDAKVFAGKTGSSLQDSNTSHSQENTQ